MIFVLPKFLVLNILSVFVNFSWWACNQRQKLSSSLC